MKHKTQKLAFDFSEVRKSIDFLEKNKIPYNLTLSNYTTAIECEYYSRQYLAKKQSLKVFAAFNKVKNDLLNWSANEAPQIEAADLKYFDHNLKSSLKFKNIFATDIKSAYATVLKNDYFIQESTFEYINSLKKDERLACVGMLASKKEHFSFDGEELNYTGTTKSELTPYFYYCIWKTSQIMETVKSQLYDNGKPYLEGQINSCLFYWVDCLYLWIDEREKVAQILTEMGYNFTQEILFDMEITEHKNHFQVEYYKGQNDWKNENKKPKLLNFPKPQTIRENLANYFLEKSKSGIIIEPN
jgi:hypothetical protein